ncbi:MAG: hypothetical protein ACLGXA_09180 [Acidobacteriota bacterium]
MDLQLHTSRDAAETTALHTGPHLALRAWGVPFRLSAETGSLLERMRAHAPFGSTECDRQSSAIHTFTLRSVEADGHYRVQFGDQLLVDAAKLDSALIQLGGHMMMHVAEHSPDYVFLHSGVVGWQNRALLLPGASFAGKSTLVAELVRAGATFYSDEFALIDAEGRVHPFPRDLQLRSPGRVEQTVVPLAQLEGRAGKEPIPVSLVIFTQFAEDARWSPEPVSPGRAVLELLLHSTPVQRAPARVLATLTAMMRNATAWRSPRGEASAAARSLLAALAAGGPPA